MEVRAIGADRRLHAAASAEPRRGGFRPTGPTRRLGPWVRRGEVL